MRVRCFAVLFLCAAAMQADEALDRVHKLEDAGDSAGAKDAFQKAVRSAPNDVELVSGYAAYLERYKDPGAREAYRRAATEWQTAGKPERARSDERRAVLLDLIAGDRAAAGKDLAQYKKYGGTGIELPTTPSVSTEAAPSVIYIPGPLRSFARMAAISPDSQAESILPALARNVVTNGFQASRSNDELEETEYLKLVHRYLSQAHELEKLAGSDKVIRVPTCESTQTNDLLRVLGYRMRGGCGSEVVLETVNASRAFLTTDSGFPLAELEQALRTEKAFSYEYRPTVVPILYTANYWTNSREKDQGDFLDAFLADPGLCRFYLGMSKIDPVTAAALREHTPAMKLRAYASVLDFFGGNFEIRDGKAVLPGGSRSTAAWSELVGVSPDKGTDFFERLLIRDDGWLASLYGARSRIHGPVQDYLTDPAHMKRFYAAVRGKITTPGPARPVFRSNADMMLLTTRLRIDPDGKPHIPGGVDVWKEIFIHNPHNRYDQKLSKAAVSWKEGDDVIEALFALCRKPVDNEPLKMFMALTDLDRNRATPLQPGTVQRLTSVWNTFSAQYAIFNDAPGVTDKTILAWLDATTNVDHIRDTLFRQDAIGEMQGLTGLWQIFCRQGSIPAAKADSTFATLILPFVTLKTNRELFDAGRNGLTLLVSSAGSTSGPMQLRILGLLAGGPRPTESEARTEMAQQEQRIFDAQKLLSPDLIFELADNLERVAAKGEKLNSQLATRMAQRVADIQLPRNSMSGTEKNSMAFGFWVDKHIDEERKLNFRALIDKGSKDPEKLKDIRGLLAPTLRDTIVGYNYVHYAPPGAEILITNPLFVRGHDFIGMPGANHSWRITELYGAGWPSNAGGRLVGSLAGLPYALAEAEQNFLVPTQTQALIWGDLVPQMILSATAPRFWSVTPAQVHWVGMHMRNAESLLAEAAVDASARPRIYAAINRAANPYRAAAVISQVSAGNVQSAIDNLTPSELYAISTSLIETDDCPIAAEIAHVRKVSPALVSDEAISHAWGTPKPTLANSYAPELLNLRTFPTLMGYSSRIMAESWESNQLYWADLADETGVRPEQLNILVPQWTKKVVERIFASHLEDWPALLKSLRSVGDEVRNAGNQPPSVERAGFEE
jgi:hypothetical protein